jgi:hypothetical protein
MARIPLRDLKGKLHRRNRPRITMFKSQPCGYWFSVLFALGLGLAFPYWTQILSVNSVWETVSSIRSTIQWASHQYYSFSKLIMPLPDHAILDFFAQNVMAWSVSTTPIPISQVSQIIKSLFSGNVAQVPAGLLHYRSKLQSNVTFVNIAELRNHLNAMRYGKLESLCSPAKRCSQAVQFADPIFGITPLHLAYQQGDQKAVQLLLNLGANPNALDVAKRAPQNMSFTSFVANSKKWAKEPTSCGIPVVDASNPKDILNIARLVLEGEPVLIRNFLPLVRGAHLLTMAQDLDALVQSHHNVKVKYGNVPYADYFGLPTGNTTLKEFYDHHVVDHISKGSNQVPQYIFQKDDDLTAPFMPVLETLVADYFPTIEVYNRTQRLVCPPSYAGTGNASLHYFLGAPESGAPFHIHADAINLNVRGPKKWFIAPPNQSIYSKKPIRDYVIQDVQEAIDKNEILTCTQEAGDIIYVPFDWGHAVLNEEINLGVALEVLNRRDTFVGWPWTAQYLEC